MTNKKISIIIPVYNEEKLFPIILKRVVEANTLGLEKEIIVVDDGSKDGSPDVIRAEAKKYGDIIKFKIKEKNGGKSNGTLFV